MNKAFVICCLIITASCKQIKNKPATNTAPDSNNMTVIKSGPPIDTSDALVINTSTTTPQELISFAQTLLGIPYKYGSTDPNEGFDCSGFITYVFNHFNITVPRSSVDFTHVPQEIPLDQAKPGDLILFTGTDSTIRVVGHMGIIVSRNNDDMFFIHSSSGKAWGVTITPLNDYYMGRFVKMIRVFPQNNSG